MFDVIFEQYADTLLLATLNAIAGWTLLTVVKLKGKAEVQEHKNKAVDVALAKQQVFNDKVESRLRAGSKVMVKHAIELRNYLIWRKKLEQIIEEVKEEEETSGE